MKETYVIDTALFKRAVKETGIKDHKRLFEEGLRVLIEQAQRTKSKRSKVHLSSGR